MSPPNTRQRRSVREIQWQREPFHTDIATTTFHTNRDGVGRSKSIDDNEFSRSGSVEDMARNLRVGGSDGKDRSDTAATENNTIAIQRDGKTTIFLGRGLRRSYNQTAAARCLPKSHLYGTPKPPILSEDADKAQNDADELANDPEKMVNQKELSASPSFLKGPLPSNWEIAYTELGEKYFIDHNNGMTTWLDPREHPTLNKRSSAIDFIATSNGVYQEEDDLLPDGWERIEDEVHGIFYVDHVNKRTQYERPDFANKSDSLPRQNGYLSTGITTAANGEPNHHGEKLPPEPPFPPPGHHPTAYHHNNGDRPSPSSAYDERAMYQTWYGATNGGLDTSPPVKTTIRRRGGAGHAFTTDPAQLKGELLTTRLYKGLTGFGFTLVGNDGGNSTPEFIQIKSILPNGPAALDQTLHTGDILVYVDNECMLGASQDEACRLLRSVSPGEPVTLQVCRGYPLVLDPTNKIYASPGENIYAGSTNFQARSQDQFEIVIVKGPKGFGFTITDSPQGQRVKAIHFPDQCPNLLENDLIVEVDGDNALRMSHGELVQKLQEFPVGYQTKLLISRQSPKHRSRTPTAGFRFGEKNRTTPLPVLPRSKTPAPQSRTHRQPIASGNTTIPRSYGANRGEIYEQLGRLQLNPDHYSVSGNYHTGTPNYIPLSALAGRNTATPQHYTIDPRYQYLIVNLLRKLEGFGFRLVGGLEMGTPLQVGALIKGGAAHQDGRLQEGDEIVEIDGRHVAEGRHDDAVKLIKNAATLGHVKLVVKRLKDTWTNGYNYAGVPTSDYPPDVVSAMRSQSSQTYDVHLIKNPNEDFGCTLVTIDHRFIGRIIPGTPAERCGRLRPGDAIVMINGFTTTHMTHRQVIEYIKSCGNQVTFTIDPSIKMPRYATVPSQQNGVNGPIEAEDAIYTTHTNPNSHYGTLTNGHNGGANGNIVTGNGLNYLNQSEKDFKLLTVELSRGTKGFGFSIRGGFEFGRMPLFILRIADDGPAAQEGSVRVGDQLMEINGENTAGMTHERAIALIREQTTVRLVVKRSLIPA